MAEIGVLVCIFTYHPLNCVYSYLEYLTLRRDAGDDDYNNNNDDEDIWHGDDCNIVEISNDCTDVQDKHNADGDNRDIPTTTAIPTTMPWTTQWLMSKTLEVTMVMLWQLRSAMLLMIMEGDLSPILNTHCFRVKYD